MTAKTIHLASLTVSATKIASWKLYHALPRFKTFLLLLSLIFTVIFLLLTLLFFFNLDPDRSQSTCQLISSRGLNCEVHFVTTYQSYIIELHRIPGTPGSPVALLQTGLIGTSADFVIGEDRKKLDHKIPSKSLAFELARAGYDVWLSNNRGSIYGKGHLNLSSENDLQFWKFSFDEIAIYDLPAVVDYVLSQTKQENLHYIGHSQGATTMFALLAEKPSFNQKLASFTAISPVTRLGEAATSFRMLLKILKPLLYSSGEVFGENFFTKAFLLFASELPFVKDIAQYVLFSITGPNYEQFDKSRLGVLLSHMPTSTSTQNLLHFDQLFSTGRFAKFDHGLVRNSQLYGGSSHPPEYDLTSITFSGPLTVIYSENDWFVPLSSVEALKKDVFNTTIDKTQEMEFYCISRYQANHLDPLIGREVAIEVNRKVVNVLKKINKNK